MRFRTLLLLVLLTSVAWIAAGTTSTTPKSIAAEPEIEFHRDVVYGKGGETDLTLNLAHPVSAKNASAKNARAKKALPVILVLHGGGWARGKKERHDALVRYLAREGFVAATAQYRLAPQNPWPAQIEDAKCAVRYLRAHCKRWGGDPKRVAALGFSAGAHLSMLLGAMDAEDGLEGNGGHPEQSSKVNAVVSYFGPTDLGVITSGAQATDLSPERLRQELSGRLLGSLLGAEFRKDPSRASPLSYVSKGDAPMLLVQGTRDQLVPYDHAKQMLDKMHACEVPGSVVFWLGLGHGWSDPELTDSVDLSMRFLDRHFRPGRRPSLKAALARR